MVFTHGSPVIVQLLCLLFCIRILFHEASKPVVVFILEILSCARQAN